MIWPEFKQHLLEDEKTALLLENVGDINTLEVPEGYKNLWKDVSYEVQNQKANRHGLSDQQRDECFKGLVKRPYHLVNLASKFNVKNIVEVGTAEGLQIYSFAKYLSENGGHAWSCDIRDVRNKQYAEKYKDVVTFCPGTSSSLALSLAKDLKKDETIDMFYIDADHRRGAVISDVTNLRRFQNDNTIWVFDDFDVRFGCFEDIKMLCKINKRFCVYRVGDAASGNPNHQVVIYGKI